MLFQDAKRYGTKFDLPLIGELDLTFTLTELVSFAVGVAFAALYTKTRHWALNNIFGITFCVQVGGGEMVVATAATADSVLVSIAQGFRCCDVFFFLVDRSRREFVATRACVGSRFWWSLKTMVVGVMAHLLRLVG